MLLLTFQAKHFWWKPFSKTLEDVPVSEAEGRADRAVVVFVHAEQKDQEQEARVFRHALKHIKWVANKGELRNVVLHSFTHLGGDTAESEFAVQFLTRLQERLQSSDYDVSITPFGYFCEWELSVFGESMAKVWKKI